VSESEPPAHDLLARVPLLASLDSAQLHAFADACTALEVAAGEPVFRVGDPGDALYIVESGTLEAVLDEGTSSEQVVSSFVPGDFFGEMALLTGQPRSATVRARTDSRLLALAKSHFDRAVAEDPGLALRLSRALSARLFDTNEQMARHGTRLATLIGVGDADAMAELLIGLLQSVSAQLRRQAVLVVLGVDPPAGLRPFGPGAGLRAAPRPVPAPVDAGAYLAVPPEVLARESDASVAALLDELRQGYRHVIVWTSAEVALKRRAALHRSAVAAVLGVGDDVAEDVARVVKPLHAELRVPVRVAIAGERTRGAAALPESPLPIVWIDPGGGSDRSGPGLDRLARILIGASVGLALSGGAAQGLAHLGVLEALVEAGIPIDMIAGTSGGALYGSMVASGLPVETAQAVVIQQTRRNLIDKADLTLPHYGIIRGRRIERMIREAIGDVTFGELPIPFRAVATNLENGDEVVLREGPVYRAVRASISIPGIFEPVRIDGRLLVDGAVVTPLPVRPVRAMGAHFIIAVHVPAPGRVSDERKRAAGHRLDEKHNLMSTIFRSYAFAGDVLAEQAALEADVCIRPDVALFGWRDYRSAVSIIHAGRQAGRAHVEQIKRQLPVATRPREA